MPAPAHIAVFLIVGFSTAGVIFRPFGLREAVYALAGALALVVGGLVDLPAALRAVGRGSEVYLFLAGMMALAELARREHVFDWLAAHAARLARGSGVRLFDLVFLTGVVVTALLSNDATAVVLTPAVCAAARAAKANPRPALFACAFVANATSFVLPISNPANLVLFGANIPSLGAWLAWFGVPSLIAIGVTWAALRLRFAGDLAQPILAEAPHRPLPLSGRIAAGGVAIACAVLLGASAFGVRLGLATFVVGLLTSVLALAVARRSPVPLLMGIGWSVIPLVAGLFVLVAGLEAAGFVDTVARILGDHAEAAPQATGFGAGALLAGVTNLMNNLPAGLLAASAATAGAVPPAVTGALLVGIDLGPNFSITGSLATILWLIAIRREGEDVSGKDFLKIGMLATLPALPPALAAVVWLAP